MRLYIAIFASLTFASAIPAVTSAQGDVQSRMQAWSKALGVACTHCHVPDAWADSSKPTFDFARRMGTMVDALNVGPLNGIAAITCWTCHRGMTRPARLPRVTWEGIQTKHAADFASRPERALTMSVYTASLGVDCSHCHVGANWRDGSKPAHAMVKRMLAIFDEIPKHFDDARWPQTQCYMCHQGKTKAELVAPVGPRREQRF